MSEVNEKCFIVSLIIINPFGLGLEREHRARRRFNICVYVLGRENLLHCTTVLCAKIFSIVMSTI